MKRSFLFLGFFSLLVFSCDSPTVESQDDKAQSTVETYLKQNINDANSYESVGFSAIESFKLIEIDPEYLRLKENSISEGKSEEQAKKIADLSFAMLAAMVGTNTSNGKEGYKIDHKFRATNDYGSLVLEQHTFYLDSTLNEVLYAN